MDLPQTDDRIRRYLNEEMTSEEMDRFEQALRSDEELKQAFQAEVLWRYSLKQMQHDAEERQQMIEESVTQTHKIRPFWKRPGLMIAAIAAVVTMLVWVYYPRQSLEQVLAIEFDQYDFPNPESTYKGGSTQDSSLVSDAYGAYAKKAYADAVVSFEELYSLDSTNVRHRFFYAFCLFRISQHEKVIELLQEWPEEEEDYRDQAELLLAGALLRKNQPAQMEELEEAASVLQRILTNPDHSFRASACRILAKLEAEYFIGPSKVAGTLECEE